MKNPRKIFGYHMVLDLYGCDPKALDSMDICYKYLNDLADLIKVHKQSQPFIVYTDPIKYPDKAGISGWIPIVESGFSIHTLTPQKFASIDIYSCKKYNPDIVRKFTVKIFKPKEIEEKHFLRGEKYVHPAKK
ncbi:MAG TPA: S-adenosylmethionine decarboxylase [bacterium]|jgi:S-adenosylmethionine decarboxylase|nr:S-adenosylmethionine decarboxylase [bacterium]HOG38052.1 S-adenosylmethionine decarboxylase [bacterium]HQI03577.1 S-adenosylmethionine decarboxylase [bacterium]